MVFGARNIGYLDPRRDVSLLESWGPTLAWSRSRPRVDAVLAHDFVQAASSFYPEDRM